MVPEGWEKTKLGKLVEINSGVAPSLLSLSETGRYPYVKVEDMNNCNKYQTLSRTYTDDEGKKVGAGAILFPKRGAAIMNNKVRVAVTDLYLDSNMMALLPNEGVSSEFLFYSLIREKLYRIADTSTIPQINNKHINPYPFLLPPLPEQKKISQILSTWDQAITATERLLENSQQRKKGLMQQLLTGKKRLPGFEGEWEELPLLKLADYVKGYTYKSNEYSEVPTDTGFLTLKSLLRGGGYSKEGLKYLTTEIDDKFLVKEGDIVFAVTDITRNAEIVGAPLLVPDLRLPQVAISMDMVKLVVKQGVVRKFLYYALKRSPARNFMRSRASGSTVLHLDVRGSKKLRLLIPKDTREQEAISEVLTIADQEIEALSQRLVWLKQEKKALMQQLLTGKRRVNVETEAA